MVKSWLLRGIAQRRRRASAASANSRMPCSAELGVLARNGARQHGLEPLAPEGAVEADVGESHRRE